ncbi:hypothetical protein N7925_15170 [Streptomyces sp. CA-278952]|uniref:hypothetical protein n=1 Tax=Streptomyces sp. CA-278952 TaxID=2980556 RepID=UPI0023675027|nr:hypothetical protein [Streptomyces sp. CA-278952]WDG29592.1 hypothetical protein N7925_15170 [Streptomyces sp. CA-278952]
MSPVTEQWDEVLRTHLALGEERSPVLAAAAFSAEAGFFAVAGRGGADGWPYFRSMAQVAGAGGTGPERGAPDDVEALGTVCEEAVHPRGLWIAGVPWQRESRELVSDAVTGRDLELALLREGDRAMWVVRTEQNVCAFVLVDGDSEAHLSEARSLTLEFDSFLVGQGY